MDTMKEAVTREDLIKRAWRLSGWQIDQRGLDEFMGLVDEYASDVPSVLVTAPSGVSEDELQRLIADAYERGKKEAAAQPPPPALRRLPGSPSPGHRYEASNGALWVYLGAPKQLPKLRKKTAPRVVETTAPESGRECRVCAKTKALKEFRKDTHSRNGRRTECLDCENKKRRDRGAAKRREKRS